MRTKTLQQTVTFKASPHQVYNMLMNSKKHQSLSGEPTKISRKIGGKFTAWGSHISGINLVLSPAKKSCKHGVPQDGGRITIRFPGGSKLKFTQIGVPPNRYSGHYRGWIEAYWTPMKEMFATGRTSERTKRRLKIDREERIKGGKFRRSISKKA